MRWDCITVEARQHLRVVKEGTIGEVAEAYNRIRRDEIGRKAAAK
jgi:hypothetical protein